MNLFKNIDKFLRTKKFWEKVHFLIKVDFRPYNSDNYPQAGLYDSLHSSYMSWNHQNSPTTIVCD